jgi:signal transduction histidine kinase
VELQDPRPTILLVDDQPANLLALEVSLAPLGFGVLTALSGAAALRLLLAHEVMLIVMDVHMPALDGYETTALIRQREELRDIPIIFLTAVFDLPEHRHRGYALGAVDFIAKPVDVEILCAKIRALVNLYTRGQRIERERRERLDQMKDLFLGAVGHDLRNPLSAIALGAQTLVREARGEGAVAQHAKRIHRASRRMQRIIDDVLDLTREHFAGEIELELAPTDLAEICGTVVDEYRLARPDRNLSIEVVGDVAGRWDAGRLGRVFANLIGNALEHGDDGPIAVRLEGRDDDVILTVHNHGDVIDAELLTTIFEPFRRGEGSVRGLGLGLYIVREIVRLHGGAVDVRSGAEGTTFSVRLPRHARDARSASEPAAAQVAAP